MTTSTAGVKTVLVADDTAFVRDRFKTALEGAGHRAVTVRSAAELLARVRADLADIDLLVVDLRLLLTSMETSIKHGVDRSLDRMIEGKTR